MQFIMYLHYNSLCLYFIRYLWVGKDVFDAYIRKLKSQKMEGWFILGIWPEQYLVGNQKGRYLLFLTLLIVKSVLSIFYVLF